jgi:hypothetical protein
MWQIIEEKIQNFSPNLCEKLLLLNTYINQRPLRSPKLNRYSNKMRKGHWLPNATVAIVYLNGDQYIGNGQHFLHSVIQSNKAQHGLLIKVKLDSEEDFAKFYRQFDSRDASRCMEDYARAEINALKTEWKLRTACLSARALAFIEDVEKLPDSDKIDLLRPYRKEVDFISHILDIKPFPKHMSKKPIIISMILAWQKCQKDALIFWEQVRDGEELSSSMPSYRLREWLKTLILRGNSVTQATTTQKEVIVRCIKFWNAFRQNKKIRSLPRYSPDKPIPRAI